VVVSPLEVTNMHRIVLIAGATIVLNARGALAQECAAAKQPMYEFQVARPAAYKVDTAVHPRPSTERGTPPQPWAVVKFVVDTSGRVDSTTFGVLLSRTHGGPDSIRSVLHLWRYTPALVGQCKVPQLVEAVIVP
jgi:hypothetical protein